MRNSADTLLTLLGLPWFSPFRMMLTVYLSYVTLLFWGMVPYSHTFSRIFIMKTCWIFPKVFSVPIKKNMQSLYLTLFIWFITFDDLRKLNPSLHFQDKVSLIMVDDLFIIFLYLFCRYFIDNIFLIMFIRDIGL